MNTSTTSSAASKPAFSISDLARPNGPCSRSEIYNAINSGKLRARKWGRRTIIEPDAWAEFLASLPAFEAKAA